MPQRIKRFDPLRPKTPPQQARLQSHDRSRVLAGANPEEEGKFARERFSITTV